MSNSYRPAIFERFDELVVGLSLRDEARPANNDMATLAADPKLTAENRQQFVHELGLPGSQIALLSQEHGDTVVELPDVSEFYMAEAGDALMTDRHNWLISVKIADCVGIALYDPEHKAVGVVHAGRKGAALNIASKAVAAMQQRYGTDPAKLICYLSPSPTRFEYGVPNESAEAFDAIYRSPKGSDDQFLDVKLAVYDQLLEAGLLSTSIEVDPRSTIADPRFHSYRRDGKNYGLMLLALGLKE